MGACKAENMARPGKTERINAIRVFDKDNILVKEETMPDGTVKLILKNKKTGKISQRVKK